MPRQNINIGTVPNDKTGDSIRVAFAKTNANFTELYAKDEDLTQSLALIANTIPTDISQLTDITEIIPDRDYNRLFNKPFIPTDVSDLTDLNGLLGGSNNTNTIWISSSNTVFDIVKWNSGSTVEIDITPYETFTLNTYDSKTDSEEIYLVWNQTFFDEVWNDNGHSLGGGDNFEISFDAGQTWFKVKKDGYAHDTFFSFSIPDENIGQYTFTYNMNQEILVRFNRGSFPEIWFDLQESNVPITDIQYVVMDVVAIATIDGQIGKKFYNSIIFSNELYDSNTGIGSVQTAQNLSSGVYDVYNNINALIRMSNEPQDAGRLYAKFNSNKSGSITFYWNATIYKVT
jgi:hypothetical protein